MNLFLWLDFLRWTKPRRRPLGRTKLRIALEQLEDRIQPSGAAYRTIDGTGNNQVNPSWGSAGTDLLRISDAAYANGISTPALPDNPSARAISTMVNNQADPNTSSEDLGTVDTNNLSAFGYAWGQFIDHDMDLTPTQGGQPNPVPNPNKDGDNGFPIPADPNNPNDPIGSLAFSRSVFDPATGTSTSNPRQQTNVNTSFLDLSQVYGSTDTVAKALRTGSGGRLKSSPGADGIIGTQDDLLPYNNQTYFPGIHENNDPHNPAAFQLANDSHLVADDQLFMAGDVRVNETLELTALQTLFLRNHNRIAKELQKEHPSWSDEQLYQEARKLNIATEQIIIYTQYLPDLLGPSALKAYTGYKPKVDPAIATEFSTVAFRFGHSMLSDDIERHGNNGLDILDVSADGASIQLAQDFFDPILLNPNVVVDPFTGHSPSDIGPILKGAADNNAQAMDVMAISDIRNLLFGNGVPGGEDLIARDIQRARDDGIGTYNQVRRAYGLAPAKSFADITCDSTVQQQLEQAYGKVDNIDPFEGGLAEDHIPGSDMGPLFTRILANQFSRLRDGDRFFYLNESFNNDELNILRQADTLAKAITANTNITNLQSDVFLYKASISGTVFLDNNGGYRTGRPQGLADVTVQLLDDSGNVMATTMTDSWGHYSFDQQTGLSATGNYSVSLVVPSGFKQASTKPTTFAISRGGLNFREVNFEVYLAWADGQDPPGVWPLPGTPRRKR